MQNQYPYAYSANDYTITYQAGLYCEKQADRNIIQSALYIGSILGLIFLTPFADEIGKKRMFGLSQGLYILGLVRKI
jgi:MFS family permease